MIDARGGGELYAAAEERFKREFAEHVGAISLEAIAAHNAGGWKTPEREIALDSYSLVPVMPKRGWDGQKSSVAVGYRCQAPQGVSSQYYETVLEDSSPTVYDAPYLDTARGIGLVCDFPRRLWGRKRVLIALSASAIVPNLGIPGEDTDSPAYIMNQFQGTVRDEYQPRFSGALRNGRFFWRNTLLRAHEQVARELGINRAALFCDYTDGSERSTRVRRAFARLAAQEGYTPVQETSLNGILWTKDLDQAQPRRRKRGAHR
jgi:hypothetical protein